MMKTNVQKQVIPSALSCGLHSVTFRDVEPARGGSHNSHWQNPGAQFALSPVFRGVGFVAVVGWTLDHSVHKRLLHCWAIHRPVRLTAGFVTSRHHRCSECSSHTIEMHPSRPSNRSSDGQNSGSHANQPQLNAMLPLPLRDLCEHFQRGVPHVEDSASVHPRQPSVALP